MSGPPPSKTPKDEGFPVATLLLRPAFRAEILRFYRFVRAADDIADDPALAPAEKLARLDAMAVGVTDERRDMLDAFRQDAIQQAYADWDALLGYCRRSAVPVGRFLLRLHGEDEMAGPPADALCAALQVLNHLQDCREDWLRLGRCYLPAEEFAITGAVPSDLAAEACTPALRDLIDRMLDRVEGLLDEAASLPGRVADRGLRIQAGATLLVARRHARALRRRDPLAERVAPSRSAILLALLGGLFVRRRGSSLDRGMRLAPAPARPILAALYRFCRKVDDIADGALPRAEKRSLLAACRTEVPRVLDGLPRAEIDALLDGMAMDAEEDMRGPDPDRLDLYCDRVASAVGRLVLRLLEAPAGLPDLAGPLGRALQLTNILRDVAEDARRGRLYLPGPALAAAGIVERDPLLVMRHPALPAACARLAVEAKAWFAAADRAIAAYPRAVARPARIMLEVYRAQLGVLERRGWHGGARLPRWRLALIAWRHRR